MKPAPFSLHTPATLPVALALVATLPNARAIAGGQSLMPMLNMRLVMPDHLIDLNGIPELQGIREQGAEIAIGAMTRQRDLEFSELVRRRLPLLTEAILLVGHRQTRNRGTIGGSLCHLDPSAELPTICMAMDASLIATSDGGRQRTLSMREFAAGLMTANLEPDELLTEVRIAPWAPTAGYGFVEFGRRHGDFAIVSAAALLELDVERRVRRISLTLGGVGAVPIRVTTGEALLRGGVCNAQALDAAAAEAENAAHDALSDPAYPAAYRQRLAPRLLRRALETALGRAQPSEARP